MDCKKCGKNIDLPAMTMHAESHDGISVEVWFMCPHCGALHSHTFDGELFDEGE